MKTCCFTGHRPLFFPWGNDLSDTRAQALLAWLRREIISAVENGYGTFICGGAECVDTYAANTVIDLKAMYPQIRLKLALPFQGYNAHITDEYYLRSIAAADEFIVLGTETGQAAFTQRDRYMIDHSELVIAVYDDSSGIKSGTYRALQYAKQTGKQFRQLQWTKK